MNCAKIAKSFSHFISEQTSYLAKEKEHILELFKKKYIKRTFILSIMLLFWSLVGAVLDSLFLGGGILALFMVENPSAAVFLPALIYFVTNLLLKVLFVKKYLGSHISLSNAFLAAVPYIGSSLLLTKVLRKHPLFRKALSKYLRYLRKKGLGYFCISFLSSKK